MFSLAFLGATGYVAFGFILGALTEERVWWLLHRPLPRPWRRSRVAGQADSAKPGRVLSARARTGFMSAINGRYSRCQPTMPHAGRYVVPRSVAGSADPPGQFKRVR